MSVFLQKNTLQTGLSVLLSGEMRKPNARERILETAGKLFQERGYSEVGINEIISTADTAKASFYQHFSSKEMLCEAWLEAVHDNSDESRKNLIDCSLSPEKKIDQHFEDLETFLIKSKFRGCPYSNTGAVVSCETSGISEQIRLHKESIRKFFRSICNQQFSNKDQAEQTADHLFILYSGATTEAQNMREIWPVQSARKAASLLMKNKKE